LIKISQTFGNKNSIFWASFQNFELRPETLPPTKMRKKEEEKFTSKSRKLIPVISLEFEGEKNCLTKPKFEKKKPFKFLNDSILQESKMFEKNFKRAKNFLKT